MRKKLQSGITYIELIAVLSIFSLMSALSVRDLQKFQYNVQIKSLANDVALKITEAQKSAVFGKLNPPAQTPSNPKAWKPAYGISFDLNTTQYTAPNIFYLFVDLNQDNIFSHSPDYACPLDDCLDRINIIKGNKVESLSLYDSNNVFLNTVNQIDVTYTRPSTTATFYSSGQILNNVGYLEVVLVSPVGQKAPIKIYSSGRIELN